MRGKVVLITLAKNMQADIEDGHGSLRLPFRDIGGRHLATIGHIHGARSQDLKAPALRNHYCGVLIDTDAQETRILSHGAQEPADAPTLREMLINDGIAHEAETRREKKIFHDAVGFASGSRHQHGFAHD
jgi:hypothetical protein